MTSSSIWNNYFMFSIESFNLSEASLKIINNFIDANFPKGHTEHDDLIKHTQLSGNKGIILLTLIELSNELTYNQASDILIYSDSFNRPELLLKMFNKTNNDAWLKLFGEFWSMCDSCSLYHEEFKRILKSYDINDIKKIIHTEESIEFYDSLPDNIVVYRGTFIDERFDGISWTTSEEVAKRFQVGYESFKNGGPMSIRYMINMTSDKFNLLKDISLNGTALLEKTVNKKDVFVITSRGENEVIVY